MKKPDRRFGKPLGPVLEALQRIRNLGGADNELFYLVGPDGLPTWAKKCRELFGVEIVGRCFDQLGYFGFPLRWDAATIDAHPVVAVDDKGNGPRVVAANLADFLSLTAYCATAWGDDPEGWRAAREEALANREEQAILEKQLCALPGVSLPSEPWVLQEKLPKVTFAPPPGAPLREETLDEEAGEVFQRHAERTRSQLLVSLYEANLDAKAKAVRFVVNVNCPEEWADEVMAHPAAREPLKAFLAEMRQRHPDLQFAIDLSFEPVDTGKGIRAAVRFALEHAGASDLARKLRLS